MIQEVITIIGVGNMGSAIARGLLDKQVVGKKQLILSEPAMTDRMKSFAQEAELTHNNYDAVKHADIVLLAIKPQQFAAVLPDLKDSFSRDTLVISIAAGVKIATIKKFLGKNIPVVRVMPTLAATVGQSLSAWVTSNEVTSEQEKAVVVVLEAIGEQIRVENEQMIDAVTAISGSGPAYVFYLAELLQQNAQHLGIEKNLAEKLARQTIIGSSLLLQQSEKPADELRAAVTSKAGTTEAAFTVLKSERFQTMFARAIRKAYRRAKEWSRS